MLIPLEGADETLVHECRSGKGRPSVYLHDVYAYMMMEGKQVTVHFCPYCGIEIQYDAEG